MSTMTTKAEISIMNSVLPIQQDKGKASTATCVTDSSGDPSESSCCGDTATSKSPTHALSPQAVDKTKDERSSPTRGVKKVPSLRRGAAGYAQLLQSAVMASIESRADDVGNEVQNSTSRENVAANPCDIPPIPPPPSFSPIGSPADHIGDNEARPNTHKRRCNDNDFAPLMPRRTHSRKSAPDSNRNAVLSHNEGDDDDDAMDVS